MAHVFVVVTSCVAVWFIAPYIPTHSVWTFGCVLLGLFAGIPAACMVAQKQRVDVYAVQSPAQATAKPTVRIVQQPHHYIVVGQSLAQLPVGQNKIEVTK